MSAEAPDPPYLPGGVAQWIEPAESELIEPGLIKTVRPNVDHYAADHRDGSAQVPTEKKNNPRTEPILKTADFVLDLNGKALLDPHASSGTWELGESLFERHWGFSPLRGTRSVPAEWTSHDRETETGVNTGRRLDAPLAAMNVTGDARLELLPVTEYWSSFQL